MDFAVPRALDAIVEWRTIQAVEVTDGLPDTKHHLIALQRTSSYYKAV